MTQKNNAGAGNDIVSLYGGLDFTINGGDGDDTNFSCNNDSSIFGGKGNDFISIGGYSCSNLMIKGGTGNDSLWGGAGNDTLIGGDGADKFIYSSGDGNDFIIGFDDKDTLTLDGLEFTSSSYNKTKGALTLKVTGGSITLTDFSATTFHINDAAYKISGKKLVVSG